MRVSAAYAGDHVGFDYAIIGRPWARDQTAPLEDIGHGLPWSRPTKLTAFEAGCAAHWAE